MYTGSLVVTYCAGRCQGFFIKCVDWKNIRCARQASIKHLTNCWGKLVKISSVLPLCFGTYVLVGSKKGAEEMQYDNLFPGLLPV